MEVTYSPKEIDQLIKEVVREVSNSYFSVGLQDLPKLNFSGAKKQVFDVLYSHLTMCEGVSPGSPEILVRILQNSWKVSSSSARLIKREEIPKLFSTFATEKLVPLVSSAVDAAGFCGKVAVSTLDSDSEKDVLELTKGFTFDGLKTAFQMKPSSFFDPKVICVDGFVESVSEIHHLLEEAALSKETIIGFFRGFSEEVIHTLKVNYERGTVFFVPVVVSFDIDGINLLNDIAVVTNNDVCSSNKGNLISSISLSSASRAKKVIISNRSVVIENFSNNVDNHIRTLQRKILESKEESLAKTLEKRIQRLGNNQVNIRLLSDKDKRKKSFMIDRCLRSLKLAIDHGVIEIEDKLFPSSSIAAGELYAKKFQETMKSIGAILSS